MTWTENWGHVSQLRGCIWRKGKGFQAQDGTDAKPSRLENDLGAWVGWEPVRAGGQENRRPEKMQNKQDVVFFSINNLMGFMFKFTFFKGEWLGFGLFLSPQAAIEEMQNQPCSGFHTQVLHLYLGRCGGKRPWGSM